MTVVSNAVVANAIRNFVIVNFRSYLAISLAASTTLFMLEMALSIIKACKERDSSIAPRNIALNENAASYRIHNLGGIHMRSQTGTVGVHRRHPFMAKRA
jgi:hypothetical protein